MSIVICFKTCFEFFAREFSEYFPKNSSRKLHLEQTKYIIDGCRFGWLEIAFVDAVLSCCLNYDLKIGKRNFHQQIALVKAVQSAINYNGNPKEYQNLCKYHSSTHNVSLMNILSSFESAKALFDHIIAGKDNTRSEKKSNNLSQFYMIMLNLPIYHDTMLVPNKALSIDELTIYLDKKPASRYLSALSLAFKNAVSKISQLDLVRENSIAKQLLKDSNSSLLINQTESTVEIETLAPSQAPTGGNISSESLSLDTHEYASSPAGKNDSLNSPVYLKFLHPNSTEESISDYAATLVSMAQNRNTSERRETVNMPLYSNLSGFESKRIRLV